jgi:hypothetical protein
MDNMPVDQDANIDIRKYIWMPNVENQTEIEEAERFLNDNLILLNPEQLMIFNHIRQNLEIPQRHIVLETASTGKSFLLRCIQNMLKINWKSHLLTASTGITALLIGGRTVHSAFAIYQKEDGSYGSSVHENNILGKALQALDYLFIDEISMLNSKIFDLLNNRLRVLKGDLDNRCRGMPFGGVSIIMMCDLNQIPAVEPSVTVLEEAVNLFTSMKDKSSFMPHELKIIQRMDFESYFLDDFQLVLKEDRTGNVKFSAAATNILK